MAVEAAVADVRAPVAVADSADGLAVFLLRLVLLWLLAASTVTLTEPTTVAVFVARPLPLLRLPIPSPCPP